MRILLLVCFVGFALCSLRINAQDQKVQDQNETTPFEEYAKVRKEALQKLPDGEATPHYGLISICQRLDETSAQIKFAVVGEMTSFTLELQPIHTQQLPDGNILQYNTSELTTIGQQVDERVGASAKISEPAAIIPIDAETNAIAAKWTPKDTTVEISTTLITPLGNTPNMVALIAPVLPEKKATRVSHPNSKIAAAEFIKTSFVKSKPSSFVQCEWVFTKSTICGTICKCCGGLIGNVVDGVHCTITCGSICPRGQTCGFPPNGCGQT